MMERLKIRIKAKPIDGKANKELIKYLSDILDIKEMDIEIFSGVTSRNKIIRIWGIDQIKMGIKSSKINPKNHKEFFHSLGN